MATGGLLEVEGEGIGLAGLLAAAGAGRSGGSGGGRLEEGRDGLGRATAGGRGAVGLAEGGREGGAVGRVAAHAAQLQGGQRAVGREEPRVVRPQRERAVGAAQQLVQRAQAEQRGLELVLLLPLPMALPTPSATTAAGAGGVGAALDDHHTAGSLPASAAAALDEAGGRGDGVEEGDQVDLGDVQSLLRDARGHQHVHGPAVELPQDGRLLGLGQAGVVGRGRGALPHELPRPHSGLLGQGGQLGLDLHGRGAQVHEHDDARGLAAGREGREVAQEHLAQGGDLRLLPGQGPGVRPLESPGQAEQPGEGAVHQRGRQRVVRARQLLEVAGQLLHGPRVLLGRGGRGAVAAVGEQSLAVEQHAQQQAVLPQRPLQLGGQVVGGQVGGQAPRVSGIRVS